MSFIWRAVRRAGGVRKAFKDLRKLRDLRSGTLVGTDQFGNKYFENNDHFYGRDRWVYYARKDYDASQVPPEWHHWLHHTCDESPVSKPLETKKFHEEHTENLSASSKEYVPYSTTRPKIQSWQPPKASA